MKRILQKPNAEVGEYFDLAWKIFQQNLSTFIIFVLVFNLPVALIGEFITQPESPGGTIESTSSGIGIFIIFYILAIVLGSISAVATPMVAERAVLGGSIDAKTALQRAVPKVPITIIVSLVTSIIVGLGLILFVIPGIYLSVNFAFILQAIALRNCGFNALQYSRNLVKGQLWKVFGRLVTIGFGFLILFLVIGFILGFAVAVVFAFPIVQVILNIILSLIFGLTGYLMSVVFTMFFLNLDYLKNAPEGST